MEGMKPKREIQNVGKEGKQVTAKERQEQLVSELKESEAPLSGGYLAERFQVSRQIIVQDIHTLRQQGIAISSTPKGYKLDKPEGVRKVFKVYHTDEETRQELTLIVDLGGEVEDVFIYHKFYGKVQADLKIRSRRDIQEFCEALQTGKSSPLKNVTAGFHYHTIWTREAEDMDRIENALKEHGYLAERRKYEPEGI